MESALQDYILAVHHLALDLALKLLQLLVSHLISIMLKLVWVVYVLFSELN